MPSPKHIKILRQSRGLVLAPLQCEAAPFRFIVQAFA